MSKKRMVEKLMKIRNYMRGGEGMSRKRMVDTDEQLVPIIHGCRNTT